MPHQRLQSNKITLTLDRKAIRESVSKLVGREGTDTRPSADTLDHAPESLFTRRTLRVLPLAFALKLRDPLFDLDHEDVIIELGGQLAKQEAQLKQDVWIKGQSLPVTPLAEHTYTSAKQIDVAPATPEHLRPPEPSISRIAAFS